MAVNPSQPSTPGNQPVQEVSNKPNIYVGLKVGVDTLVLTKPSTELTPQASVGFDVGVKYKDFFAEGNVRGLYGLTQYAEDFSYGLGITAGYQEFGAFWKYNPYSYQDSNLFGAIYTNDYTGIYASAALGTIQGNGEGYHAAVNPPHEFIAEFGVGWSIKFD